MEKSQSFKFIPRSGRTYTTDNSDLKILVHKVFHVSERTHTVKLKATLVNKINEIVYERQKNMTLELKNIQHWKYFK